MKTKTIILLFVLACATTRACDPPPPPTNLTLTVLSPYQIRVQVTPGDNLGENFRAFRSINDSAFVGVNSGYPQGGFTDILRIMPSSEVCYKVQAFNSCGASEFTPVVMTFTPYGAMPNQDITPDPFNLSATVNANGTVALHWQLDYFVSVAGQGQNVYLQRSTDGIAYRGLNSLFNRTSYTDATAQTGVTYYYRARTSNNYGWPTSSSYSDWSNVAAVLP